MAEEWLLPLQIMQYRKFKATQIFDGTRLLDGSKVLITGNDGVIKEIADETVAGDDIEIMDGILSPGFINCHCHLELSHLKGLFPQKTGLVEFVKNVITQRHFSEEVIIECIQKSEQEMFNNGIVAVGDICNTAFTINQKQKSNLFYHNFIEVTGWNPGFAQARLNAAMALKETFSSFSNRVSVTPHAPYSISRELWQLIQPFFTGQTITLHNQETPDEDELFISGGGKFPEFYKALNIMNNGFQPTHRRSIYTTLPYMQRAATLILVHNTFMREKDIDFVLGEHDKVFFCLCPNANVYIENALPPVDLFRKKGCSIVFGTDSLASNNALSILSEMKTLRTARPEIPVSEMLGWATSNGALAMGMNDMLGKFEPQKKPGIICIDKDFNSLRRIL